MRRSPLGVAIMVPATKHVTWPVAPVAPVEPVAPVDPMAPDAPVAP